MNASLRYARRLLLLLAVPAAVHGQAVPAGAPAPATGGSTVAPDQITYSLSASESAIFGYQGVNGASNSFNISGNAGYVSGSERHPTSFVYSGGYFFGNNGQPSSSFQNLGISQVYMTQKWTLLATDIVSYLPVSPRFGLSGVPGVGDIGTTPVGTGVVPSDALLSNYGRRITNTIVGGATYRITGRTSVRTSGSFSNQYFLDDTGIPNDQAIASGELDHQFTYSTLVGGSYNYSRFTYPGSGFSFISQSVSAVYQHTFNPQFILTASAGPQWTSGSNAQLAPSSVSVAANLSVNYNVRRTNYTLTFNRGTSAGSGVLYGAQSLTANLAATRQFTDRWTGGLFASYGHANALTNLPGLYTSAESFAVGAQATRRLGQYWSAYGSYAAQFQSVGQLAATNNAFSGTAHVISLGISYSPRPIHVGRR